MADSHRKIIFQKDKNYLEYDDGTPFFWLADTWWFAMTSRAAWPEPFQTVVKKRKEQGFTVLQVVIGYPPEVALNSPHAQNSGGFPFTQAGEINQSYFAEVDVKINYIIEQGLVPCIFGSWGHHIDVLGVEKSKLLWEEIIRRYGDLAVVFCLTGEADLVVPPGYGAEALPSQWYRSVTRLLPTSLKTNIKNVLGYQGSSIAVKQDDSKRIENWKAVAAFVKKRLSKNTPLTVHVGQSARASQVFRDAEWLDIDTFQSGHQYDRRGVIVSWVQNARSEHRRIINLEPWYEQIGGQFDAVDQRYAFWMSFLAGATGFSYGAHGLWNMATTSDGFLSHWGKSDWQSALVYPGAAHIGAAVNWLETKKWWLLKPVSDVIAPSWNSEEPNAPLAAQIENEIIIYLPSNNIDQSYTISTKLLRGSRFLISWYDLETMEIIRTEKTGETGQKITSIKGKDQLLSIKSEE